MSPPQRRQLARVRGHQQPGQARSREVQDRDLVSRSEVSAPGGWWCGIMTRGVEQSRWCRRIGRCWRGGSGRRLSAQGWRSGPGLWCLPPTAWAPTSCRSLETLQAQQPWTPILSLVAGPPTSRHGPRTVRWGDSLPGLHARPGIGEEALLDDAISLTRTKSARSRPLRSLLGWKRARAWMVCSSGRVERGRLPSSPFELRLRSRRSTSPAVSRGTCGGCCCGEV